MTMRAEFSYNADTLETRFALVLSEWDVISFGDGGLRDRLKFIADMVNSEVGTAQVQMMQEFLKLVQGER